MSKNPVKTVEFSNPKQAEVAVKTAKRQRKTMHSVQVLRTERNPDEHIFICLLDRKVISAFVYEVGNNNLNPIPDMMGAYAGITKFVRDNKPNFQAVYTSRVPDLHVAQSLSDQSAMNAFLNNYLSVTLKQFGAIATETQPLTLADDHDD